MTNAVRHGTRACAAAAIAIGLATALSAAAQVPAGGLEAQRRPPAGPASAGERAIELAERNRWLEEGEAQLAAGHTDAAQQAFDRAALLLHAADAELALVRTYMQAGEYRHALAFAAHAAGAHPELPGATALYAWLLHIGGQGVVAGHQLDEALALAPADAALLLARRQLASPWPRAEGVLARPPLRLKPYDASSQVPAGARIAGTAVLLGDGRLALVPAALVAALLTAQTAAQTAAVGRLWVRNGLGQVAAAQVAQPAQPLGELGLVLLQLDTALAVPAALGATPRDPFAGSPGSMVEFGESDDAAPAWPLLRQGFFGAVQASNAPRLLGITAPRGPRGGPVFDRAGRLAGIAVAHADGRDRLVAVSALALHLALPAAPAAATVAGAPAAPAAALDAVYEAALRTALQVITAP